MCKLSERCAHGTFPIFARMFEAFMSTAYHCPMREGRMRNLNNGRALSKGWLRGLVLAWERHPAKRHSSEGDDASVTFTALSVCRVAFTGQDQHPQSGVLGCELHKWTGCVLARVILCRVSRTQRPWRLGRMSALTDSAVSAAQLSRSIIWFCVCCAGPCTQRLWRLAGTHAGLCLLRLRHEQPMCRMRIRNVCLCRVSRTLRLWRLGGKLWTHGALLLGTPTLPLCAEPSLPRYSPRKKHVVSPRHSSPAQHLCSIDRGL